MGLNRELDGYLVVAMEQAVAAPYCSLLLADAGARVIKLERPEGDFCRGYDRGADGQSTWFAWLNRGKESVVVDYTKPEDAALMHRLIARADVFLHNLSPGALARHGFGADVLRAANPGLINLQISGYGTDGVAAQMKAYDFLVQAESGVCSVTGTAEQPARVGVSLGDISTGLTGFSAILRGLLQRGRTGLGVDLSISLFDVLADWMNMPLLAHRYLPAKPERMGLTHSLLAPYGAYETADGAQILIAIQNNREWGRFCAEVLACPEMARDPRFVDNAARVANRVVLDVAINNVFCKHQRDDLAEILQQAGIAWARLSSLEDLSNHPFLRGVQARFGAATVDLVDLPVQSDAPRQTQVPQLGEHSDTIRREFSE
ncbi:MAG: CoA transferase [Alphaproteobacteria bacterium]|nr:CoA transferase [Alphaproteobacteria bacterium]